MARTPQTPGATKTTAADKAAAAALEAEQAAQEAAESEQPTGVSSEPVPEVNQSKPSPAEHSDRFDQMLKNQARIEAKIDRLLRQQGGSSSSLPKKTRWVEGKHGLEQQEI